VDSESKDRFQCDVGDIGTRSRLARAPHTLVRECPSYRLIQIWQNARTIQPQVE